MKMSGYPGSGLCHLDRICDNGGHQFRKTSKAEVETAISELEEQFYSYFYYYIDILISCPYSLVCNILTQA